MQPILSVDEEIRRRIDQLARETLPSALAIQAGTATGADYVAVAINGDRVAALREQAGNPQDPPTYATALAALVAEYRADLSDLRREFSSVGADGEEDVAEIKAEISAQIEARKTRFTEDKSQLKTSYGV